VIWNKEVGRWILIGFEESINSDAILDNPRVSTSCSGYGESDQGLSEGRG
jgi:hypothetical protein